MIYFDLDGVLRDLSGHVCRCYKEPEPKEWNFKVAGTNFMDMVLPCHLEFAETSPYFDACLSFVKYHHDNILNVLTSQPYRWRQYSDRWLITHFAAPIYPRVFYVDNPKRKFAQLKDGDILVDDYPFDDTRGKKVIRVMYPYNKDAMGEFIASVSTPQDLYEALCQSLNLQNEASKIG